MREKEWKNISGAIPGTRRNAEGMLYRYLGSTGVEISAIGLGGAHLLKIESEKECMKIIRTAIDRGLTFMDNCWDYGEGITETRMGRALGDGYRRKVFLMTKIDGRTKKAAARQINESLKRLRTDYVDLMQFHEIIRIEDPDRIFTEGGAIESMVEAQKAGKVRHIGFTGHKDPLIHIRMLDIAARHGFRFDAVQMPLNVMDAHFRSFEHTVLPVLVKEGIGVLGMKSMADGAIPESGIASAIECLQYALDLPTSTVITGIDSMERLDQAFKTIAGFRPLSPEKREDLLSRTKQAARDGKYELFKTHVVYDGTAIQPAYLGYELSGK